MIRRLLPVLSAATSPEKVREAATAGALELLSAPAFSRFVGRFAQARVPAPLLQAAIRLYIQQYGVDTSEIAEPLDSFETFDAFFTRKLKPGIHTVDPDPAVAVSPVDGRVLSFGRVADGRIDQVKGRSYALDELLQSRLDAEQFKDGWYVTIYLSPRDYHRIHSPSDGRIVRFRYVPGRLYPVNALGVNHVEGLFAVNERLITYVDGPLGAFAVCKVGATNVGMISASYHSVRTNTGRRTGFDESLPRRGIPVARGDELGMFHLGSTVVLVSERPDVELLPLSRDDAVRMGQRLFIRR